MVPWPQRLIVRSYMYASPVSRLGSWAESEAGQLAVEREVLGEEVAARAAARVLDKPQSHQPLEGPLDGDEGEDAEGALLQEVAQALAGEGLADLSEQGQTEAVTVGQARHLVL